MFSAKDVKELREKTGAGMLDCKKALDAANGNMEAAIDWLRENGMAKAAKKQSRVAAEGLTKIVVDGNNAVILEVNSETDFVAKNEEFTSFVDKLANVLVISDVTDMDFANQLEIDGITVEETLKNLTAKIGEKLSFRRFEKITKNDNESFGTYSHMGGKIAVLIVAKDVNSDVARDVAMHACAMNPSYVNISEVPADVISHEEEVIKTELLNEGKPADRLEGIVKGKLNKFYSEIVLEEQLFIKSESKETVKAYVSANGGKVVSMIRYAVGEGIEKREENFADEVMSQINGK